MRERVRRLVRTEEARSAGALYLLHLAGYVLPLVAFPYLIVTLGPAAFGIYGFVIAAARYGIVVTDWSFNLTATRDAAVARSAGRPVDELFSRVLAARLVLLGVFLLGIAVLSLWVPPFSEISGSLWIAMVGVGGSALMPIWLFQAYHRLPMLSAVNVALRAICTALLFVFVSGPDDLWIVLWLWSISWLGSGLYALFATRQALGVRLRVRAMSRVTTTLRSGGHLFISSAAVTFYTAGNVLFLGLLSGNADDVGVYVAAETIVVAAVSLIGPLGQALFPTAAQRGAQGVAATIANARRVFWPFVGVGLALGLGCAIGAPLLGGLIFDDGFQESVHLIQIMSVIPVAVAVATVFGQQMLVPLRMDGRYTSVIVAGGIVNVALIFILVPGLGSWGSAVAVTATEALIAAGLYWMLRRAGIRMAQAA